MNSPMTGTETAAAALRRVTTRALLLGDRIDTSGLERADLIATTPLAFRSGDNGYVAIFRYGVVVLAGLTPIEEDDIIRALKPRIHGEFARHEEESAIVEAGAKEDQIPPGGPISVPMLTPERFIVIADALAKSTVLARDEREVGAVLDIIEPSARALATTGRTPERRKQILQHIGQTLLVRHRVSGRVAVEEKPDALWDRPDLERLYARLEDEYELKERAAVLNRKLAVIGETATALTDLIDTNRSLRLEATIVLLIVFEIVITFYQMWRGAGH